MAAGSNRAWPGGRARRSRFFNVRGDESGHLVVISALAGREYAFTLEELAQLLVIPEDDWVTPSGAEEESNFARLAGRGLVLSEEGGRIFAEFRRREAQLRAPHWNRHAAVYHAMTRWSGVHATRPPARQTRVPDRWPPPGHFHEVARPVSTQPLPQPEAKGPFFDLLQARRTTTRGFDPSAAIDLDQLSTILYWVWGCHGTRVIVPDELTLVRKSSPSGGAQHPIEVYPLVRHVDGLASGLYHYSVGRHALELVDELTDRDPLDVNLQLLAGQSHFASASVVFYMTCRFGRTFWKYPHHAKAYKVVLFDAAHLSQTLYMLCAHLGLGAFVTAAFNEEDVDRLLGVPRFTEGAVLVSGCGHQASPQDEPEYVPYGPCAT